MDKKVFTQWVEEILFDSKTKYFQISAIVDELFDAAIVALEESSEDTQIQYFKNHSLDYASLHWDQYSEEIFQRMETLWSKILESKVGKGDVKVVSLERPSGSSRVDQRSMFERPSGSSGIDQRSIPERILFPPKEQPQQILQTNSSGVIPIAETNEPKTVPEPKIVICTTGGTCSINQSVDETSGASKKKRTVFKLKTGIF